VDTGSCERLCARDLETLSVLGDKAGLLALISLGSLTGDEGCFCAPTAAGLLAVISEPLERGEPVAAHVPGESARLLGITTTVVATPEAIYLLWEGGKVQLNEWSLG